MYRYIFLFVAAGLLGSFSIICFAQSENPEHTPFDPYVRVAEKIFVYDKSQFSPYVGPDVSHWKLRDPHAPDGFNHESDRKRLGVISLTPKLRAYLDALADPMSGYYELRDIKSGELIHSFQYDRAPFGLLLFSGQGIVYEFRQPEFLCYESTTTTSKYIYDKGKLVEVPQPLHYLNDAVTTVMGDLNLYSEPSSKSSQVAFLPNGTKVTVLSYKHSQTRDPNKSWYLIKTPLGLTGWVGPGLEITSCD